KAGGDVAGQGGDRGKGNAGGQQGGNQGGQVGGRGGNRNGGDRESGQGGGIETGGTQGGTKTGGVQGGGPPAVDPAEQQFTKLMSDGQTALNSKQYDQAVNLFTQATKLRPKDGSAARSLQSATDLRDKARATAGGG